MLTDWSVIIKAMVPKIVDREQRRDEIGRAAFEVFLDKGFEALSIAEVAKVAGIGKGTVYEYFDSKEALVHHGIAVWIIELEEVVERLVDAGATPEQRIRDLCAATMHEVMSEPRVLRAFVSSMSLMFFNERFRELNMWKAIYARFGEVIAQTILDGVADGSFRPEIAPDAEKIAINLLAYLDGIGMHWMLNPTNFDLHQQIESYLQHLFASLRARRKTDA
jgi:AcrR family transcriptional regulator